MQHDNTVPNRGSHPANAAPQASSDSVRPVVRSIFSAAYWREATRCAGQLRMLILAALMVACRVAITSVVLPLGPTLRISFGFFVNAAGAYLYGPVLAPFTGLATDLIGYLLHPTGGSFFPGYTLTAMAGSLVYALFLFRKRITLPRLIVTKLAVNLFINVGMNSLWSAMLYGKGFYYYVVTRLAKNLLMLPIEVLILALFFRAVLPAIARAGLIPLDPER